MTVEVIKRYDYEEIKEIIDLFSKSGVYRGKYVKGYRLLRSNSEFYELEIEYFNY